MTSPEPSEAQLHKLTLQLQRSFSLLSKCVAILKEACEPTGPVLRSLENLVDQYQCCSKVHIQGTPLWKHYPDVQEKLLYKITLEMEKEFSKLQTSLNQVADQSDKFSKQYDTCMRHHRQHSHCLDLRVMAKRSDSCPSIVDMLCWLQKVERLMRQQYLCKKYLLETFDIRDERQTEQFVKSWSEGDKEMIDAFERYLSWTVPFLEQKLS